ncbi:hypothetical protein ACV07N_06755 [Roseivirga echinicomitans]
MESKIRLRHTLRAVIFIMLAGLLSTACRSKDDSPAAPTEQELTYEKLAGQWSIPATGGIMVDGVDRSANYQGFQLSFTEKGYTTTNAGNLFKATGTWNWANTSTVNELTLDDGKAISIQSLSTSQFVFSFTKTGSIKAGSSGSYTITVNK